MKVVILAGGFGTRLAEYTEVIPKPMVPIGGKPILWHIMNSYAYFGHQDFYIALGYKSEVIKNYFLNYYSLNSNFTVDLSSGKIDIRESISVDWRVSLVDTGAATMTGGRIKRMKAFLNNEPCLITYGDGLSDVDINALIKFHKSHGKMVTMTAVRPGARFGELEIGSDSRVQSFKEKPQLNSGWINGGFFVVEPEFFDLIAGDETVLEREPIETVTDMGELVAYRHKGFWQCMDTKRDHDVLETMWHDSPPWFHGKK